MTELATDQSADPVVAVKPIEFPGRWLGGAVGVLSTLIVAGALALIAHLVHEPEQPFDADPLIAGAAVAVLGVPIAFVLGRHYAPVAGDGGWRAATFVALCFALLAPPLGDLEIVFGVGLAPWTLDGSGAAWYFAGALFVGLFGLVVSFVALPVTAAVAFVWIVLMRLLPPGLPARVAVPPAVSRFGVRHLLFVLVGWFLIAWAVWAIVRPPLVDSGFGFLAGAS